MSQENSFKNFRLVSLRTLITMGGSKVVTIPSEWLLIKKWLGKDVKALASVANEKFIVLTEPENEAEAIKMLGMDKIILQEASSV